MMMFIFNMLICLCQKKGEKGKVIAMGDPAIEVDSSFDDDLVLSVISLVSSPAVARGCLVTLGCA